MPTIKSLILAQIPRVAEGSDYPEAATRARTEPVLAEIARKARLGWYDRDSINDLWDSISEVLGEYFSATPRSNGTTIRPCIARDVVAGFDFSTSPVTKTALYEPDLELDLYVAVWEDGSLTIRATDPGQPEEEQWFYPVAPDEPEPDFLAEEVTSVIRELRRPYQR